MSSRSPLTTDIGANNKENITCQNGFTWNAEKQLCEKIISSCPLGFLMNKEKKICVKSNVPINACSNGYTLDPTTLQCIGLQ